MIIARNLRIPSIDRNRGQSEGIGAISYAKKKISDCSCSKARYLLRSYEESSIPFKVMFFYFLFFYIHFKHIDNDVFEIQ